MSNFERTIVDFGKVRVNQTLSATYLITGDKKIKTLTSTCHCIEPLLDRENNQVKIGYTVADIPVHLIQAGVMELEQTKGAEAIFEDGTKEQLNFKYLISKI